MIIPVGFTVLVKPDDLETVSKGGIVLAIDEERESAAQTTGKLVGYGEYAWKAFDKDENGKPSGRRWANIGDRVIYSKYAGKFVTDTDTGIKYVILNDDDIRAIIKEDAE